MLEPTPQGAAPVLPTQEQGQAQKQRRRIYLMRHGSVTYFDAAGKPVLPEQVPLNEAGRAQADAAGMAFAAAGVRFDKIVVSGLPRTVETAQRVLAAAGPVAAPHAALETWPALQELRGGRLADIAPAQLRAAFTDVFSGPVDEATRFLGGESVGQLLDRVHPAVKRLRDDPSWSCALLVLHGGVNCAILSLAMTGARTFLGNLAQAPACINALDVGDDEHDWVVRYMNHTPPAPLQAEVRSTTMEELLAQYTGAITGAVPGRSTRAPGPRKSVSSPGAAGGREK